MPSERRQFHLVLDEATEQVIFELVAQTHDNPTKLIKDLVATHPRVLEQARLSGLMLDPGSVKHGGKREKKLAFEPVGE